jgi:RND family efflux transporter MFP subunit
MSNRTLIIVGIVVLGVFVGGFFARFIPEHEHQKQLRADAQKLADAPPLVDVAQPQPLADDEELKLPADVRPQQQTAIYARVDGFLGRWLVDINDHVDKGQLLATIDAPDTDAQLNQAKASLEQARANAKKAESDMELANATYKRYYGLLASGSVTQQDLDTRQSNATQAQATKAAADAAVDTAQAMVQQLAAQQGFERIIAPFAGTITWRSYDVGARISASDTAAHHELFDIADIDTLRVYVNVPQNYVLQIHQGQAVYFMSPRVYGERRFKGVLARSTGTLDPATRTLLAELDFDNRSHELWAGMYGEAAIDVHFDHPTLTVPTTAMMFESDGTQVAVVDGNNKVHFRKVLVGQDLGTRLEILGGVTAGEKIVSNPGEMLTDGADVQIAPSASPKQPAVAQSSAPAPSQQPTTNVAQTDADPPAQSSTGGSGK